MITRRSPSPHGGPRQTVTEPHLSAHSEQADGSELEESKEEETVEEGATEDTETVDEEVQLPEEEELEGGEEPEAEMDMDAAEEAPAVEADVAAALQTIADALGAAGIDIEVKGGEEEMPAEEPEMDMGDEPAEEEPMQQEMCADEEEEETLPMEENDEFINNVANKVLNRIRETLKKNK